MISKQRSKARARPGTVVNNSPPKWSAIPAQSGAAGQTVNLAPYVSDPDGNSLTFSLVSPPVGYSITSAGVLTFGSSSATVTVRAFDGTFNSDTTCAVTVQVPSGSDYPYVVPGIRGFGVTTRAGAGGEIYRVTSLANTLTQGTLRHAVETWNGASATNPTPRTVIFEVGGYIGPIDGGSNIVIRRAKLTIAGQTAPSPGITYRGGKIECRFSDVLVQHMRFRAGDGLPGVIYDDRDAGFVGRQQSTYGNDGPAQNVVFANCTFAWSIDEIFNVSWDWDNLTFYRCIFGPALHNTGLHSKGAHGYGVLLDMVQPTTWKEPKVAFIECLLTTNFDRNPLSRAAYTVFSNNIVYNRGQTDINLESPEYLTPKYPLRLSAVGNHFKRGAASFGTRKAIAVDPYNIFPPIAGTTVYVSGNYASGTLSLGESQATQTSFVQVNSEDVGNVTVTTTTPPIWPNDYTAQTPSAGNSYLLSTVLPVVGARPLDRDSADATVITNVQNGTGEQIDSVVEAGGWPTLGTPTRALTTPADPNTAPTGGYTNLETWLQGYADALEP